MKVEIKNRLKARKGKFYKNISAIGVGHKKKELVLVPETGEVIIISSWKSYSVVK